MSEFNESVLDSETNILPFDCDNEELNGFLFDDAKNYHQKRLAKTYLFDDGDVVVAYWSLLNDSLSIKDFGDNMTEETMRKWYGRVASVLPIAKHKRSYPAVKIGRLAIHKNYQRKGIGKDILDLVIYYFTHKNISACRFITVDALTDAIQFYEKNGFKFLTSKDRNSSTRIMYYELI